MVSAMAGAADGDRFTTLCRQGHVFLTPSTVSRSASRCRRTFYLSRLKPGIRVSVPIHSRLVELVLDGGLQALAEAA